MPINTSHIDAARLARLIGQWESASISAAAERELESLALDYAHGRPWPSADVRVGFDSELMLIAALADARQSAAAAASEAWTPEELESIGRRFDRAIHQAALSEEGAGVVKTGSTLRRMRRRWLGVGAAAAACCLLFVAGWHAMNLTRGATDAGTASDSTGIFAALPATGQQQSAGTTDTLISYPAASSASAAARTSARNRGPLLAHAAPAAVTPQPVATADVSAPAPAVESDYAYTPDEPEEEANPVYLPAMATLPADRADHSPMIASKAINSAAGHLDDAFADGERSVARVALLLEDLFGNGISLDD